MPLEHAKRMQEDGRRPPPAAYRGKDVATTNDRDMNMPGDDASSTSGDRRADEVTYDRRGQADGQFEERDENAGTNVIATSGANERRRNRNSPEDANR